MLIRKTAKVLKSVFTNEHVISKMQSHWILLIAICITIKNYKKRLDIFILKCLVFSLY